MEPTGRFLEEEPVAFVARFLLLNRRKVPRARGDRNGFVRTEAGFPR